MADPPGSHLQNPYPSAMEEQLVALQQQQQQAQEQQRRLQEELRRFEGQRLLENRQQPPGASATAAAVAAVAAAGRSDPPAVPSSLLLQQQNSSEGGSRVPVSAAPALPRSMATLSAAGLLPFTEHGVLQALQVQQGVGGGARLSSSASGSGGPTTTDQSAEGRAAAPSATQTAPSPGAPSALEAALSSLLFNPAQQQQARQSLDNIQLLRTLQQLGVRLPAPQPPPQDPLTALLSTQLPLGENLDALRLRANLLASGLAGQSQAADSLLNNIRDQHTTVNVLAAAASNDAPGAAATAAPASAPTAGQKRKQKKSSKKSHQEDDEEEEEYPLPDLPKVRPLPPLEEGDTRHYSERVIVPLATEEDSNWLSERQCFIRAELLEVVRASHQDVLVRSSSKSVAYQQVGIRCRYCAHLHPSARAIRSSAYPSSIRQMYQSFTMMVRDHWAGCTAMPPNLKKRFMAYQEHKIPSSSLSREYWAYAADKIGMINTEYGITITEESLAKAEELPSFGTTPEHIKAMQDDARSKKVLVHPSDQQAISPYLFLLMNQVEECYLLESEQVGKRKDAPVGLTGFGCQHCIKQGRLGFCRVFPLNKRSLPTKVNDLYNHLQRCPLTPPETRSTLRQLKRESSKLGGKFNERDREFIDQIWTKLGRKGAQIGPSG